jgi:hypothetical protein
MRVAWRASVMAAACCAALFVSFPSAPLHAQGAWRSLFDGKTLAGWDKAGDANWTVKEGAIWASGGGGYLVTPAQYGDFQFTVEFWVTPDANSGVFIRCADPKTITAMNCYEVNIFDLRPDPTYRTGGIVNIAKPLVNLTTGNKWNTFDVTAKGSKFTVVLNGTKVVDNAENADRARGFVALQYGAGIVRFRNIRLRTL